jgi:arylsulfatase A-like enzyme
MELESMAYSNPSNLYWPRVSLQTTDDGPYHGKAVMCRTKDFKYVRRLYEKDELYDLNNDPGELFNLIDDLKYKDIRISMTERMLTWYVETCDVVPFEIDLRFRRRESKG